jgi:hypothetical protein
MSRSPFQRSPTDCGASCVIKKPHERGGHSLCWAAEPEKLIKKIPSYVKVSIIKYLQGDIPLDHTDRADFVYILQTEYKRPQACT